MRSSFVHIFMELAGEGHDVHLLTADLGFGVFEPVFERFPERITNVGIAEQNMIGIAAGMAMVGKKVFCYSMAPFLIFRAMDQIRADLCAMNLPVVLVGVGGGLSYGFEGMTHHAIEDFAVTRALPNLTVTAPADPSECRMIVRHCIDERCPCYMRLLGNNEPDLYAGISPPEFGKLSPFFENGDIAIIANGSMVSRARSACELLRKKAVECSLYSMHTVKPIDINEIRVIARKNRLIVSIEEHSIINGIGSAIADILLESGYHNRLIKIGIPDEYSIQVGDREWLRDHYGLGPEEIAARIETAYADI